MVSRAATDPAAAEHLLEGLRMEGLGRLAWGIGHDFNNVLASVLCYCRLVEIQLAEADAARADVAEIRAAAARGQDLARLLMAFSRRPQRGRPAPVDLAQPVESLLRLLRHNFGDFVTFRFIPPVRPIPIALDVVTFSEMLLELLVAARRSLPSGGEIAIAVSAPAGKIETIGNGHLNFEAFPEPDPGVLLTITLASPAAEDIATAACCWPGPALRSLTESIPARTGCRVTFSAPAEPARSLGLYVPVASGDQAGAPVDAGASSSPASKAS